MNTITLKTKPIPINHKYGVMNGCLLLTKAYRDAKDAMAWETRSQWRIEPYRGSVAMTVSFYYGDRLRRDIDAYIKILLDSMTGIVYKDDSQIVELHVFKHVDKENPRVELKIYEP